MNMNKWTVGLAAAGLVSLASVAQAQDSNSVQTKLATTSLSGYVSTSYQWAIGKDASTAKTQRAAGADRFAVDVISLTLASPQSSGDWGAGYNVQLWVGDDASALGLGDNEIAVKNAYLSLQVPMGKGLSVDVGRFDTILGMESIDSNRNPHYTHSNGYAIEPTLHEGLKTSYQLTDNVGVSLLLANTIDASNNGASGNTNRKTYGVALNMSAPESTGFLSGSTLDVAYITGDADGQNTQGRVTNMYLGASIPVPIDNVSVGIAWDNRSTSGDGNSDSVLGLYVEYKASDKLTLNLRGERVEDGPALSFDSDGVGDELNSDAWDLTLTANYALWDGVTSRLEYRYTVLDNPGDANSAGVDAGSIAEGKSHSLYANLVYEF